MAKVISFMNNKGGVGKTITAHTVGLSWARMGKRILFVDLDSQGNLTSMVSVSDPMKQTWDRTIEDAFLEGSDGKGLPILHTENPLVDYVPADLDLANFEKDTVRKPFNELLLMDLLDGGVKDPYDFVIIDCAPAIQKLTYNAMIASDYLAIVTTLDGKSAKGVEMTINVYNEVIQNKRFNPSLKLIGIIATMYMNDNVNKFYWEYFQKHFSNLIIHPYIRRSTMVDRATSFNQSIFEVDPKGRVVDDYLRVAQDLLVRIMDDMVHSGEAVIGEDGIARIVK